MRCDHAVTECTEIEEKEMSKSKKKGKKAMNIAIYMLLITWIVLLLLLIGIYVLRLQGYDNFMQWKNRNQVQEVLQPEVVTPKATATPIVVPTCTPAATDAPIATIEPTEKTTVAPSVTITPTEALIAEPSATSVPTEIPTVEATVLPTQQPTEVPTVTPTPMPTKIPTLESLYTGHEVVDAGLQNMATEFFTEEEELNFTCYDTGIFHSVVFKKGEELLPVVYDMTTGEQVTGSDLIKETYFAIVKERLQSYVAKKYPKTAESEFVSYDQTYQVEDYETFYLTGEHLVFYFEEGVLAEHQPAFSYELELSEAKAFFYKDLEGNPMGHEIRELDPDAKMIAITFDDGPHPKVEDNLLNMLEEQDVKATFFFLGHRIYDWYPKSPGQVFLAGHEVGSHTYSHELNFARVTAEQMWTEVNQTNLLIAKSTGYAPDYIRFPGGTDGKRTKEIPMVVVNWNMDSVDYREKNKEDGAQIIYERLKNSPYLGDGNIVLLHSIYENSYKGVEQFIIEMKKQGYVFVTLSELFYYKGFTPETGIVYYDGYGATKRKK